MRSTMKALAGLCLLLLTSACIVETEATLGDPDTKAVDARLVGSWYAGKGGEVVIISAVADEMKPGAQRAVFVNVNPFPDGDVEGTRYSVWRTVVNGQGYLNVRRTAGNVADTPKVTVMAYDIGGDGSLVLRLMDPKKVIAAIEAGKLKGRFKKGQYVDEATITATREELTAFIASSNRDELFSMKTGALRKLADTPADK